ncbi:SET domain-containing protein [Candidatus Woesearchaeota archaeon]|nr:SET domain-containing protein [Candidatus Woesearchaeota archaeon]
MLKDLEVKESKIGKRGVFAKKGFRQGELILKTVPGTIIHKDEFRCVPYSERWNYYDEDHYYFMSDPEFYINHSCDPNVFLKDFMLRAMKPIKKGEEICYDYSLDGIDKWKMKCNCGSKICRKLIDGRYFKLPKKLQKKYLPYLPAWFRKAFRKELEKLR